MQVIPTLVLRYEDFVTSSQHDALNATFYFAGAEEHARYVHMWHSTSSGTGILQGDLYLPRSRNQAPGYARPFFSQRWQAKIRSEASVFLCAVGGYTHDMMGGNFSCDNRTSQEQVPVQTIKTAHAQSHDLLSSAFVNRPVEFNQRPCLTKGGCNSFVNAISLQYHLQAELREQQSREL